MWRRVRAGSNRNAYATVSARYCSLCGKDPERSYHFVPVKFNERYGTNFGLTSALLLGKTLPTALNWRHSEQLLEKYTKSPLFSL